MTTWMIFGLGLFVTLITVAATVLVGLGEAADPDHSRERRLRKLERAAAERVGETVSR